MKSEFREENKKEENELYYICKNQKFGKMETIFRLTFEEMTTDFIKSLKSLFKEKNTPVTITIGAETDETEYLLSTDANRKILGKSLKEVKEGKIIKVNISDLK